MKRLTVFLIALVTSAVLFCAQPKTESDSLTLTASVTPNSWGLVGIVTECPSELSDSVIEGLSHSGTSAFGKFSRGSNGSIVAVQDIYLYYYAVGNDNISLSMQPDGALKNTADDEDTVDYTITINYLGDGWWMGEEFNYTLLEAENKTPSEASVRNSEKYNSVRTYGLCKLTLETEDLSTRSITTTAVKYTGKIIVSIVTG